MKWHVDANVSRHPNRFAAPLVGVTTLIPPTPAESLDSEGDVKILPFAKGEQFCCDQGERAEVGTPIRMKGFADEPAQREKAAEANTNDNSTSQLLLTSDQAANLCAKSRRTWWSWDTSGLIPRPVRIGHSTLWRAEELRAWIAADCPRRSEWEAMQRARQAAYTR